MMSPPIRSDPRVDKGPVEIAGPVQQVEQGLGRAEWAETVVFELLDAQQMGLEALDGRSRALLLGLKVRRGFVRLGRSESRRPDRRR